MAWGKILKTLRDQDRAAGKVHPWRATTQQKRDWNNRFKSIGYNKMKDPKYINGTERPSTNGSYINMNRSAGQRNIKSNGTH